jgi:hypothetical protein
VRGERREIAKDAFVPSHLYRRLEGLLRRPYSENSGGRRNTILSTNTNNLVSAHPLFDTLNKKKRVPLYVDKNIHGQRLGPKVLSESVQAYATKFKRACIPLQCPPSSSSF